jgi:hypothetical protein
MTDRELMQMARTALELRCTDADGNEVDLVTPEIKALRDRLAQPEREWVGLTHEELGWLNEALNLGGRLAVIEAIEAKLKEKNT